MKTLVRLLAIGGFLSGPYLVLPVFGPSIFFRDGFGLVVDGYARPQKYILEDEEGLYWAEQLYVVLMCDHN